MIRQPAREKKALNASAKALPSKTVASPGRAAPGSSRYQTQTISQVFTAPLPKDPKLTELEAGVKAAEEPVRLDPVLVQLREDAKASIKQSENKRLTVVQDLTWALINSPGFLFNH